MISKKLLLGLALRATNCTGVPGRLMSSAAATSCGNARLRWDPARRPHAPALRGRGDDRGARRAAARRADQGRRQPVARCGIVRVFDAPFRGTPLLAAVFPADVINRELSSWPRVRTGSTRCSRFRRPPPLAAVQDDLLVRASSSARTACRAQELGQCDPISNEASERWASTHARAVR